MDTDSSAYWGSGHVLDHEPEAKAIPWQRQPFSLCMTLPPLSTVILKPLSPMVAATVEAEPDPAEPSEGS